MNLVEQKTVYVGWLRMPDDRYEDLLHEQTALNRMQPVASSCNSEATGAYEEY